MDTYSQPIELACVVQIDEGKTIAIDTFSLFVHLLELFVFTQQALL